MAWMPCSMSKFRCSNPTLHLVICRIGSKCIFFPLLEILTMTFVLNSCFRTLLPQGVEVCVCGGGGVLLVFFFTNTSYCVRLGRLTGPHKRFQINFAGHPCSINTKHINVFMVNRVFRGMIPSHDLCDLPKHLP